MKYLKTFFIISLSNQPFWCGSFGGVYKIMMLEVLTYLKENKITPNCQVLYMWLVAEYGYGVEFSISLEKIYELSGVCVSSIKKIYLGIHRHENDD